MEMPLRLIGLLSVSLFCFMGQDSILAQRVVTLSPAKSFMPHDISVAINPGNPGNILVLAKRVAFRGSGPSSHLFFSSDAGRTWAENDLSQSGPNGSGSGFVGFDADGAAMRCYLPLDQRMSSEQNQFANRVFIRRSVIGDHQWGPPMTIVDHQQLGQPDECKPWFVVDRMKSSSHKNNIYVAWSRHDAFGSDKPSDQSQIMFSASYDDGKNFTNPVSVSDQGGDCKNDDNTLRGALPVTSIRGEVYLVWSGPRGLQFDASTDGGKSWGKDRVIAQNPGGWCSEVPGLMRHHGMPVCCVDRSFSIFKDSIYVCWVDERNKDKDVFLITSRDRGKTWTQILRVNNDAKRNGSDQFLCWMAVDPLDGSVNIVFYDRSGLQDGQTGLTLARSVDGGRSFDQFRIDVLPFKCNERVFLGDYIGIDAIGGRVVAAFPHFSEHDRLVLSAAIFDFVPGENILVR